MAKPISREVLEYIQENYIYRDGEIDGPYNENIGYVHRSHSLNYIKISIKGKNYKRSHIVWFLNYGYWPIGEIDHINRDSLDDRVENLKEVTTREQQANRKNTKMYKGFSVHYCDDKVRKKPWRVRNQRLRVSLGYFESEEDSKVAIDKYIEEKGKWWF